jgi:hypothetical protein
LKKLKLLFHCVPSMTNACNLASHLKTTLEYLKPTPNIPNSNQDPLPTMTNTRGTSTSKGTKHTKTMRRDTKRLTIWGSSCTKKAVAS